MAYVYNPNTGELWNTRGDASINIANNPMYSYDPNTQLIMQANGTPLTNQLTLSSGSFSPMAAPMPAPTVAPMVAPTPTMSTPMPMAAAAETPEEPTGLFDKLLGNIGNINLGQLGGTILSGVGYNQLLDQLSSFGQQAQTGAQQVGAQAAEASQFKPFTVYGPSGQRVTTGETGGMRLSLSPTEQSLQNQALQGARQFFNSAMGRPDAGIYRQEQVLNQLFNQQVGQMGVPSQLTGLTGQAYSQGQQRIGQAVQPMDINALRGQFAGQVGQYLGQQPSLGSAQLQRQAYNLGSQGLAQSGAVGANAQNIGLNLAQQGAGMFGDANVSPLLGSLSQTALDLGTQGLGVTPAAARGVDVTGSRLMNLGSQYFGQDPSLGSAQLQRQAYNLGAQGLSNLQAPSDIESLRSQYADLAGQAAGGLLTGMGDREQQIYERIRATQTPEEQRQRLALEERLAAQGRLGTSSAAYGGATPEQLALETAQAEARNRASLAAIEQSRAEQAQQLQTAQTLGGMTGQFAGISSDLQSAAQQRASQLSQLGLSTEQIRSQLESEGLGRGLQATQAGMQAKELSSALTTQAQNRAAQLAQLGLSSEQIQSQLQSEGLGRGVQTLQAGLQAQEVGSGLQTAAQQRAAQLSQLGLSTEQIRSQLESEGLGRAAQAGGLAGDLASTASGIESQALQRGLSLAGLGMQGSELAQGLTSQQLQNLLALQGANIGSTQAQQALRQGNLALGTGLLTSAYAPQAALLNVLQQGLQSAALADVGRRQAAELEAQAQMSGLDAALQAQLGRANLGGQGLAALAAALGGTQQAETGGLLSGITLKDIPLIGDLFG